MYKVIFSRRATKEVKRRGKKFKEKVKAIGKELSIDPYAIKAKQLTKPLDFVYSYHFSFTATAYRLAFIIDDKENIVSVILVAPRENFYQKLKRMLG